jgi:2-polyprenyl-3-methyl-5-hydroxy-6-metoxy-1,4-benzoquinol methylase
MSAPHPDFPNEYYHDADLRLARAIPEDSRDILDIGCGEGRLGEFLKNWQAPRRVTGIEKQRKHASLAAARLDAVLVNDIEQDTLPLEAESFDCIVADETLARCANPCAVLERLRPLLRPGGHLIASLPNQQHWSRIDGLLRGEGLAGHDEGRIHTTTDITRRFLDAGYLPRFADQRYMPAPADWLTAMQPAIARHKLDPVRFAVRTQAWQYFIDARPIDGLFKAGDNVEIAPVTVGVCTNDPVTLRENLLASPCLHDGGNEILTVEGAASAAEGLNAVIAQAKHELVVLAHQDVYLPAWWINRLWRQYDKARRITGDKVGVMGVFGVLGTPGGIQCSGRVCDRDTLIDEATPLPIRTGSLDELALIVPRNTPLRFDPALGFHLYGTDICLTAENLGLHGMVIDAPCHHNSKQGKELPVAFEQSKSILRKKWADRLPIATPCAIIA